MKDGWTLGPPEEVAGIVTEEGKLTRIHSMLEQGIQISAIIKDVASQDSLSRKVVTHRLFVETLDSKKRQIVSGLRSQFEATKLRIAAALEAPVVEAEAASAVPMLYSKSGLAAPGSGAF